MCKSQYGFSMNETPATKMKQPVEHFSHGYAIRKQFNVEMQLFQAYFPQPRVQALYDCQLFLKLGYPGKIKTLCN